MRKLLVLAKDKSNPNSRSLWSLLPQEVILHIIALVDFRTSATIGKSARQIYACAQFIFNHIDELNAALNEAVQSKQTLKVIEKIHLGNSRFRFFPAPKLSSNLSATSFIKEPIGDEQGVQKRRR